MSNNNLKNATMAAVLTAVIVTIFGLQLIRQGARTTMESNWSLVAMAAAVVFVLRPGWPSRSRN